MERALSYLITKETVKGTIAVIHCRKAPGPDRIQNVILKKLAENYLKISVRLEGSYSSADSESREAENQSQQIQGHLSPLHRQ